MDWEFAGVASAVGAAVARFKVGDRVFGTGDMTRGGCWAESVAVDHRVVAVIPERCSEPSDRVGDGLRADLPRPRPPVDRVLILGGAGGVGGVGSLATQL